MLNRVVLVGRITRDLEIRKLTNSNNSVVNFSIALSRLYSREEKTDFINCVAWNKTAENMARFLGKGSLIAIDGRLQTNQFEARDGTKRSTTEVYCENVQFLESRNQNQKMTQAPTPNQKLIDLDKELGKTNTVEITDEDLPW